MMLRSFAAVLFVLTVVCVAATGVPVGPDQPHARSSIASQEFDQTKSATTATTEDTSMKSWVVAFCILALVATGIAMAYRTGAIGTSTTDETDTTASTISEEELMADEDRVLMLLHDNDGRMRQVNIVNETGWSKSKVSVLLSDMDEEGLISKLRVGRENLISITGDEPEAARSPFDDDQ
jgi:uncharacterized membrane protein